MAAAADASTPRRYVSQVNQGTLIPGSEVYSTFSLECIPTNGIGQTDCGKAPYAGCMTAPCSTTIRPASSSARARFTMVHIRLARTSRHARSVASLVWSAAYAPPPSRRHPTARHVLDPVLGALDDREGIARCARSGSWLMLAGRSRVVRVALCISRGTTMLPPGSDVDCAKVCNEYNSCQQSGGAQAGYTCDATLCTDECNDRDLVGIACQGLPGCEISEIIKAETAANCSCCASQLCGCSPSVATNTAITSLTSSSATAALRLNATSMARCAERRDLSHLSRS